MAYCENLHIVLILIFLMKTVWGALYGCQADNTYCSTFGYCNPMGFCICNAFYYGERCHISIAENRRIEIIPGGQITDGALAGIILAYLIGWPLVIILVFFKVILLTLFKIDILYKI